MGASRFQSALRLGAQQQNPTSTNHTQNLHCATGTSKTTFYNDQPHYNINKRIQTTN